jgi:hypothetical protein
MTSTTYVLGITQTGSGQTQQLIQCEPNSVLYSTSSSALPTFSSNIITMTANGQQYPGNLTNTAPPAGYLGERIASVIASGSAVSLTTATPANITSISLTPGVWDVSAIVAVQDVLAGTILQGSISTTSATNATSGDSMVTIGLLALSAAQMMTIPAYRMLLASTTTVYLVASATFTLGAVSAYGRISAVRVA